MASLLDDLGLWVGLGVVTPITQIWTAFPSPSLEGGDTFRISFLGDLSRLKSYCYLRVIYQLYGSKVVDNKWYKLHPKQEKEILILTLPVAFNAQNLVKYFEIKKFHRYARVGLVIDQLYSVNLEEFKPYAP